MKYNELRHTHGETATDSDDHSGDDSSSAASPASVHSGSKDTFVCDILFRCDSVMVDFRPSRGSCRCVVTFLRWNL